MVGLTYRRKAGRGYSARRKRPRKTGFSAGRKSRRDDDLSDVPEPGRWLSEKERAALLQIDDFSSRRNYRYGLNEDYVYYREAIPSLFKKKLIFYKKAHGKRYWLPTKKGRNIAGQLVLEAKWSDGFWDMAHAHD